MTQAEDGKLLFHLEWPNPLKYDFNGIEVIIGMEHVLDLK